MLSGHVSQVWEAVGVRYYHIQEVHSYNGHQDCGQELGSVALVLMLPVLGHDIPQTSVGSLQVLGCHFITACR